MSETLATALAFARNGHAVLPLWWPESSNGRLACACRQRDCRSPCKHPVAQIDPPHGQRIAPNGLHSATTDSGIIKHWWALAPEANLGVVTQNLIPLDIDPKNDGLATLAALERDNGKLPPTWTVVTGSGGLHYYFRRPPGLSLTLPMIATNVIKDGGIPPFGEGIDLTTYLVAPPSRHISGRNYTWEADGDPREVALADAPDWIVARLTTAETERTARNAMTPEDWAKMVGGTFSDYRDDAAARVSGKLLRAVSLPSHFVAGLLHAWNQTYCRPPLPEHELRQIFQRIAAKQLEQERSREK
ncbi:MAG TPA: bifunctional DNA primase/polymerase [Pseudaminobacter sp.]|nr:bifunctional DNA primase/polymerase [Pseudaminobacter sp.]